MKKLFGSNQQSSHVGKTFQVGRFSLTVEDVIAEGGWRGACLLFFGIIDLCQNISVFTGILVHCQQVAVE